MIASPASTPSPLPTAPVVVVGIGARTHAGLTALQTALAVRAGKMRSHESHMIDRFGERIGLCRLGSISDDVFGMARYPALAAPALAMAAHPWIAAQRARTQAVPALPIALALPSTSRPDYDSRRARTLLATLQAESGVALDPSRALLVNKDRAGGVAAILQAFEWFRGGADAVLVGGIDSHFDPDVLELLDRGMRLHSLNAENGFIPGEGAAFLVLARRSMASALRPFAQIFGAAIHPEPRPYGSPDPCHALAMSKVIQECAESVGARSHRVGWVLTDVVNERHRVDEWQLAAGRCHRTFTDNLTHDKPLLKTGDVGAASVPLLLVIASALWQVGAAAADCAIVAAHSDGAERGAVLVGAA